MKNTTIELKDKRVLLIIPKYFGYEEYIKREFEKKGAVVYMIYENINHISLFYRAIYVFFKGIRHWVYKAHFEKKIRGIKEQIDTVVVIHGDALDESIIEEIRSKNPECRFILYQWDSTKNNPSAIKLAPKFDSVLTFDKGDADKYGWTYRPLFFIQSLIGQEKVKKYDYSFIGLLHSKRVQILHSAKKECNRLGLRFFYYLYSVGLVFFRHKFIQRDPEYINVDRRDVSFRPLSLEESYKIYGQSKAIIDFSHPGQQGLTMRTIECLGQECKLITNNKSILQEEFYNPENIYVYSDDKLVIPEDFLNKPYIRPSEDIYRKYSLSEWVDDLVRDLL